MEARKATLVGGFLARSVKIVALASALLVHAPAWAQMKPVDPYFAVVSGEKVGIVCMANDNAYSLGEVKQGALVRIDAEDARWARIEYPSNLAAYVKADDAKLDASQVTLTKPTKLFALNALKGGVGSWKAVFDVELPIGTTMTLADNGVEKQADVVLGYHVIPPTGAKAFVDAKGLRRATQAEIEKAGQASMAAVPPVAPSGGGLTPPGALDKPAEPAKPKPEPTTIAAAPEPGTVGATIPTTPPAQNAPAEPAQRRVGNLQQLESSFAEVRKQPILTAEIDEITAEFRRAIDATPADQPRLKQQLEARLKYLELQKDYRETLRRNEESVRQANAASKTSLQAAMEQIEKTRVYTIVGTLQPSTVYDGQRLPRMFRIQSVGDSTPRTIGYLAPSPEFDLEAKVGQVVGVIGDAKLDPSLKLNIISPMRVDLLKPGSEPAAPSSTTHANEPTK